MLLKGLAYRQYGLSSYYLVSLPPCLPPSISKQIPALSFKTSSV